MVVVDAAVATDRLVEFAHTYVARRGFHFGDGAAQAIDDLAAGALSGFAAKFPDPIQRERMREPFFLMVEAQLAFFIETMILAREDVYDQARFRENVIGEDTFARARNLICPLWPLCS